MINGFCFLDKPTEVSSMKYIAKLKWNLSQQYGKKIKLGHTGTLDPFANGVLPVCLGEATKLVKFFLQKPKTYEFVLQLGIETNTLDSEGEVVQKCSYIPTQQEILEILSQFKGIQKQTPPAFSAIHIKGERAYKLARKGVEFEIPSRDVEIYDLQLLNFQDNLAIFRVSCGSGTYIRSLGRDLAIALKTCGHLQQLRRTEYAGIDESMLCKVEEPKILGLYEVMKKSNFPLLDVTKEQAAELRLGKTIQGNSTEEEVIIVHEEEVICIAHFDNLNNQIKPVRVLVY